MKRVIKFKAWSEPLKRFVEDDENFFFDWSEGGLLKGMYCDSITLDEMDEDEPLDYRAHECVVLWHIGRNDINGKEIFEGSVNSRGGVCTFYKESCAYKWSYGVNHPTQRIDCQDEVVGMIYDYPHSLN